MSSGLIKMSNNFKIMLKDMVKNGKKLLNYSIINK
jgi:hypothetical protein